MQIKTNVRSILQQIQRPAKSLRKNREWRSKVCRRRVTLGIYRCTALPVTRCVWPLKSNLQHEREARLQVLGGLALETGASILDSQTVEKGYCQNSSERDASLPVGQLMFRRLCVRFTDSAMITYTGVHPGAPSDTFDADFQTIIDSVQFTR